MSNSEHDFDFSKEAEETDRELAGDIQKLRGLTDEQIKALLPNRADQDELNSLIAAVNAAASENEKKAVLMQRLQMASGVVRDVVRKVMTGGLI